MPRYDYQCGQCQHTFTQMRSISERKNPESEACPSCGVVGNVQQKIFSAPLSIDSVALGGVVEGSGGFKEVLKGIHDRTPGSQINTYL